MDLTVYYKDLQFLCILSILALLFAFLVISFLCIRTMRDNSVECNRVWKKILFCFGYAFILLCVLGYFFSNGLHMAVKDIGQKTIYGYQGEFEIVEIQPGYIYDNVLIIINGSELRLKISESEDESYEANMIIPGKYNGKIVYAQHWAKILHIEMHPVKDE